MKKRVVIGLVMTGALVLSACASDSSTDKTESLSEETVEDVQQAGHEKLMEAEDQKYLDKFVEITEATYPEKSQRILKWNKLVCYDTPIGYVEVADIDENGTQDLSWFCEDICDWLEECMAEVPYEKAPWIYQRFYISMPGIKEEFDLKPYINENYDREELYTALYTFVDESLTNAYYTLTSENYGALQLIGDPTDSLDLYQYIEPDCTYVTKDNITYGMIPFDRAAGSSYYMLIAYKDKKKDMVLVNEDPFRGMGGEAKWLQFIDDTDLGFACLAYSGGNEGMLYRTEDGGKSFFQINYPSAMVRLADGSLYNPFVIPERVWKEDDDLYMLAGQSPYEGDYYSDELEKHPSGLYISHNNGLSFEYVGEQ